jgi:hypothetical protein
VTRDEEFNDIPELGPARDVLDQTDIPTLKPVSTVASKRAAASQQQPTASKSGGLMPWLLLLLMIVVGAGGYWGMVHFNQMQQQLILANQRLTDLEGLINATDQNANKSGAALQVQIKKFLQGQSQRSKHVDSELAKLWTVSYQRNKPKISEIDKSLAALDKQSDQLVKKSDLLAKQSDQLAKQVTQTRSGLDQAAAELKTLSQSQQSQRSALTALGTQMQLWDLANQELDALQDSQLLGVEQKLLQMQQNPSVPKALADSVQQQQQTIASINSFRKQVNAELLRLAQRIDQLQRAAKASAAPAQ